MLARLGLIVVNVDFEAKAKLSAVGIGPTDGAPRLVATLPTASGVTSASKGVQPLQQ